MNWLKKLIVRKHMQKVAENYKTTVLGVILSALLAADADWHVIADAVAGGQWPTPEQASQIGRVVAALVVALLGYFAKDATPTVVKVDASTEKQ